MNTTFCAVQNDIANYYRDMARVEQASRVNEMIEAEVTAEAEAIMATPDGINSIQSHFDQAEWDKQNALLAVLCGSAERDDKHAAIDDLRTMMLPIAKFLAREALGY